MLQHKLRTTRYRCPAWSGSTIQYMKAGTSSYTGEPDPSHPKIPQNYLSATGGTPPYKFETSTRIPR